MQTIEVLAVILLFVFATAAVSLSEVGLAQQMTPMSSASDGNFTAYTNPEYGFSLLYPLGWINDTIVIDPRANISFLSSFSTPPQELGESAVVYLAVKDLTGNNNTSLQQFVDKEIDLLNATSPTEDTSSRTILQSEPTSISGNTQAYRVVYSEKASGNLSKVMEIYTVIGDKGYVLSYLADAPIYDKYLPTVQKMIDSFKVALIPSNNTRLADNLTTDTAASNTITNKPPDISSIPAARIKFSMYSEPSIGIEFPYPTGWEPILREESDNFTAIEILFPNTTSSINSANFSSAHWHGPSTSFIVLSIAEEPLSSSDPNATAVLESLTKQKLALANQTLPDFKLIESNSTTLAGNPAHRIVYSLQSLSTVFQSMNIWTVKGGKEYMISYSQPEDEYPIYLPVVQQMIESFKITG